jgi:hypothetical protein
VTSKETIEDIAKDIVIKERVPRRAIISYIITITFTLGPVCLFLDLLFADLFDWLFIDSTLLFSGVTALFFISSLVTTRQ